MLIINKVTMNDYYGFKAYIVEDGDEAEECNNAVHMIRSYNHYCKTFNVSAERNECRENMATTKRPTFPFIFCEGDNLFQYEHLNELKEFLEMLTLSKLFKKVVDEDDSTKDDKNNANDINSESESESEDYGELISAGEMLLSSATEFSVTDSEMNNSATVNGEIDATTNNNTSIENLDSEEEEEDETETDSDSDSDNINGFDLHGNDEVTSEDSEEDDK